MKPFLVSLVALVSQRVCARPGRPNVFETQLKDQGVYARRGRSNFGSLSPARLVKPFVALSYLSRLKGFAPTMGVQTCLRRLASQEVYARRGRLNTLEYVNSVLL